MTPSKYKESFDQIIKALSHDRRKKTHVNTFLNINFEVQKLARERYRQIEKEEREMKRMKWKKDKRGNWIYNNYTISKLNPLPFRKKDPIKYWLGKTPFMCDTFGVGIFPDMETAKYVAYLIDKK